jgi:uncharacterized protein (TIGR00369 family)
MRDVTNLELLRRGMVGKGPRVGWAQTVGARIAEVGPGRAVVELHASAEHRHDGGVVQGGIITQIADAAMGMSIFSLQEEGMANTTVELKINFIRPVVEGLIRATATVVSMRPTLFFSEADVTDERGRLIAHATSTCLAIPQAVRAAAAHEP